MKSAPLIPCLLLLCCVESSALILGRDAESKATDLEKRGKYRDAAVMRLAAARGYEELIIPFEKESARSYAQLGESRLAAICKKRAEVEYPKKVRDNRGHYEKDLKRARDLGVRVAELTKKLFD